jgi:hypothetical protein
MAEEPAIVIDDILGSKPTNDGRHALLKVLIAGNEVAFALPEENLLI